MRSNSLYLPKTSISYTDFQH